MDADVVVVGAGPVGSSLCLMLRLLGLRAVVLDRASFPRDKPCGEGLLPSGSAVLAELGIDLAKAGFPRLEGVRYRLPGRAWARAPFSGPAFGVRRVRLDALLAELAGALTEVEVGDVTPARGGLRVETSAGALRARAVVGADGLRSRVRRLLDPDATSAASRRYGLVGHLDAPGHGRREITVTLLDGAETYLAPSGPDELLVAVLGSQGTLRRPGRSVQDSYLALVGEAHPDLARAALRGRVHGAGPFHVTVRTVAMGRLFLAGDASGFCDPLTGDAISSGLEQARALAGLLAEGIETAAPRYRAWHAAQWRRRRVVGRLALLLAGSPALAARALDGVARRPDALRRLVEASDGSRPLSSIGPADWAALAGLA